MSTNTNEGEILTIGQVAGYLKVTQRTIYRLAAAKEIPAFEVGRVWRFSRVDIDGSTEQQSRPVPGHAGNGTGKLPSRSSDKGDQEERKQC